MSDHHTKVKVTPRKGEKMDRSYQSEVAALQSMRLIAAPDPEDDLSDEELMDRFRDPAQSPELIHHLIDFIKAL